MPKTLYIEPYSGIAGDMFVAALSELASGHDSLFEGLMSLSIKDEFTVSFADTTKNGMKAKRFIVKLADSSTHLHGRTLKDITKIINSADKIASSAKSLAINIFKNLAEAEAAVHGKTHSTVHFHEVGAVDAIVDIVSAAILIDGLDISKVISAPISLGQGTVKSAHGIIPVPSPATLELVKGLPVNKTTIKTELTTPTGAAIIKTITDNWEHACSGTLIKAGYGAGTKDIKEMPNSIRASLYEHDKEHSDLNEKIIIIECNLDDYSGEHLSFFGPQLLKAGALDFAVIPATMKKGRHGMIIQVLSPVEHVFRLSELLLLETSTLGIRYRKEKRVVLERKCQTIDTPLGRLNIKLAMCKGKVIKAKPEQSDIERISQQQNKNYFETYKQLDYYTQQWLLKNS